MAKSPEELMAEKFVKMEEGILANKEVSEEVKKQFSDFLVSLKVNKDILGAFGAPDQKDIENKKAFDATSEYLRKGQRQSSSETIKFLDDYKAKMLAGDDNPAIGYLLPENISTSIIEYVREKSPMRQEADVMTISKGNSYTTFREVTDSEWEAYTRPERVNVVETEEGKILKIEIYTHELTAMPIATLQMLEDAEVDLAAWIRKKIGIVFAVKEGTWFVKGTGLKEASGFLNDADITVIESAASGAYGYDDLVDLQAELKTAYAPNAKFYMSRKQWAYVLKLKDSENRPLVQPGFLKAGDSKVLLGEVVVEMPDMPDGQTSGTKVMAYGDMKQAYLIVDRKGLTVIRDDITSKGAVKFWFRKRTGGKVVLPEALKILKTK